MSTSSGQLDVVESKPELTQIQLGFQVTDVKKPLVAVKRICEKVNVVQFGPGANDNFISNKQSGAKMYLKPKGRSYVMQVQFGNGEWSEVTVDSAAEESVCPKDWAQQYGMKEMGDHAKMKLVNAKAIFTLLFSSQTLSSQQVIAGIIHDERFQSTRQRVA